jgi:FkbM family methyltransferase
MTPIDLELSGAPVRVEPGDQEFFWSLVRDRRWEVPTLEAIARLAPTASLYVDVGAWIGPTVLAAAAAGAPRIVAYEPDPVAREELDRNLALNPDIAARVTVRPVALTARNGKASLASHALGIGMSSLLRHAAKSVTVTTVRGDEELGPLGLDARALVKIDVEGAEFDLVRRLLPMLRRTRPTLLVSWHSYHLLERHPRTVARLANVREKLKVVRLAALYRHWYWASADATEWRELDAREKLLFFLRIREAAILFATRPVLAP